MTTIMSQITRQLSVCSAICWDSDWQQINIKGLCYYSFVREIHQGTNRFPAQRNSNEENVSSIMVDDDIIGHGIDLVFYFSNSLITSPIRPKQNG